MFNLNDGLLYSGIIPFTEEWQITLVYLFSAIAVIAVSYLLGSVNSAIIISKTFYNDDIRKHGSGNAGLTNVNRTYGLKAAGLTLLGDMLKSVLSVLFAALLFVLHYVDGISISEFCYVAGLFAVLGHVYPVFYGFKGGKGVLVAATMTLILAPLHFLALLLIFAIIVGISRYVSLGSVSVAALLPVSVCLYIPLVIGERLSPIIAISLIILGSFVIWCHRSNIKRLISGNEKKISIGGKKKTNE